MRDWVGFYAQGGPLSLSDPTSVDILREKIVDRVEELRC